MNLTISLLAASILLRWDVPGPGSYYLYSTADGGRTARIEACGYVDTPCHAAFTVPKPAEAGECRWFFVRWDEDERDASKD